ncbi:hypothetical protein N474_25015 [Pseudoalteromonas luteoviolacea CPMOR-2]|nr:hypothetical protein N474_25015 [Pseudoalteromonas luteoviolacea CPMOR-2]
MTKRTNRSYPAEFKQEAVALVTEQRYEFAKAAASLGIYYTIGKLSVKQSNLEKA